MSNVGSNSNRGNVHVAWLIVLLLTAAASFFGGYYYQYWKVFKQDTFKAKVIRVLDGDTIEVELFGDTQHLRIVGLDTFETKHCKKLRQQSKDWGLTEAQGLKIGQSAKKMAEDFLLERYVTLRFPGGAGMETDAFGRLLAYVYIDGRDFGKMLIEEGLAYARPEDHLREKYYQWPVMQARNAHKGMFAKQ